MMGKNIHMFVSVLGGVLNHVLKPPPFRMQCSANPVPCMGNQITGVSCL